MPYNYYPSTFDTIVDNPGYISYFNRPTTKNYIEKMIEDVGPGIKILLMDSETTSIISMVYAQSEIFQKEVYLFENITNTAREPLKYLKCIAFLRPTKNNINLISYELKDPKYGSYFLFFSNIIMRNDIKMIAESDEYEVVKEIKEYYADYIAISSFSFSLNLKHIYQKNTWYYQSLERCIDGILSVFLSLKRIPVLRYQGNSEMALRLTESIHKNLSRDNDLFSFRQSSERPLLLIMDRREDVVTPLLHQWTYQAMVHDLIGINNNRVSLLTAPGVNKENREIVLSPEHDDFYFQNQYLNYGELSQNIKVLMDEYQVRSKTQQKLESISDMKEFVEHYPQFKKLSGKLSKHITLLAELSRLVSIYKLLHVSEIEQTLASGSTEHSKDFQSVKSAVLDEKIRDIDALKLVLLYELCYESYTGGPLNSYNASYDNHNMGTNNYHSSVISTQEVPYLGKCLKKRGLSELYLKMIKTILEFGGLHVRNSDLFGHGTDPFSQTTKKVLKGIKGIDNIYTQHKPLLNTILDDISKSRLKENAYPYFGSMRNERPKEIVVFIIGGITYEEILNTYLFNKANDTSLPNSCQVVLGGTNVINSQMFLELLNQFSPTVDEI